MPLDPGDVNQIVETIWTSVLDWPVRPVADPAERGSGPCVVGSVRLRGAWEGVVVLDCPAELARQAAAVMFAVEAAEVTGDQASDAAGELTNMVAGNLKALLPAPSFLSLPGVRVELAETRAATIRSPLLLVSFECTSGVFTVGIFEGDVAS